LAETVNLLDAYERNYSVVSVDGDAGSGAFVLLTPVALAAYRKQLRAAGSSPLPLVSKKPPEKDSPTWFAAATDSEIELALAEAISRGDYHPHPDAPGCAPREPFLRRQSVHRLERAALRLGGRLVLGKLLTETVQWIDERGGRNALSPLRKTTTPTCAT
jgi:hypothetical protein